MKKIISILFLVAFVASVTNAQYGQAVQLKVIAGDTITNTGTANKIITCTAGYRDIAIQPVVTKTSGTVAGNTILYGSLDGTNYISLGDTLKSTDQTTNTKIFTHTGTPYVYYKVVITGSGTMVARWKVWYILRKESAVVTAP
jgi:hypothetical protein